MEFYRSSVGFVKNSSKLLPVLFDQISDTDLVNLKDALYKMDFWGAQCFFERLQDLVLRKEYDTSLHLAIMGIARETLFGMLLLFAHLEQQTKKLPTEKNEFLLMLYVSEILGIKTKKMSAVFDALYATFHELRPLLELWIGLDDNPAFFDLMAKNWKAFVGKKSESQLMSSFSGEDLLWFRGMLKNISYYNKRFVIPR